MKIDFSDQRFEKPIEWIKEQIKSDEIEEYIVNPLNKDGGETTVSEFLIIKSKTDNWNVNEEEWLLLIEKQFKDKAERSELEFILGGSVNITNGEINSFIAPTKSTSSWVRYKKMLLKKGLSEDTVENIETDSLKILNNISSDTSDTGAVKGLVVGSVQSGKTTNMGALMSLAADYEWNVFIVLAGMIEKLRVQTNDRLLDDLTKTNGGVNWTGISDFENSNTQRLDFNRNHYIVTSLKQKNRLENLIDWISKDPSKTKQMKVLIIDDEADQASVNTAKINEEDRKTINKLLVHLVNNEDKNGNPFEEKFKAVNYIGYTATPYANVLNESSDESLYPKNFISLLQQSRSYIGPMQIFGVDGNELYPGIDIVRNLDVINNNEKQEVTDIHDGSTELSQGLKESISYFLAASASLRIHEYKKPLSMLIHTSNRKNHHDAMFKAVMNWLNNNEEEILYLTEKIWNNESSILDKKTFKESYPNYEQDLQNSYTPHNYSEIKDEILNIISEISTILIDEDNQYVYHNGLHVSIDNSDYNSLIDADNKHYRLRFPKKKQDLEKTPLFIVIGGNTLSRGLTIEGLLSTYFLRVSGSSDTLMQMGRWFGYRVKYELYPRIWLTDRSISEFEYLSLLDYELREEIKSHNIMSSNPIEVGLKIRTSPHNIKLMLTANNKRQRSISSLYDFSGASIQTVTFNRDIEELKYNLSTMEDFINSLGSPTILDNIGNKSVIWSNVDYSEIGEFLSKYRFSAYTNIYTNMPTLLEWNKKMAKKGKFDKWNVIVVGTGEINSLNNNWKLDNFSWNMVKRTRLSQENIRNDIKIKVLRGPSDLYRDIDLSTIKDKNLLAKIKNKRTEDYNYVREELGMSEIPQLFLYRIDHESKPNSESKTRTSLDVEVDIAGLYISIPGSNKATKYTTHVTIDLKEHNIEDDSDLEGVE